MPKKVMFLLDKSDDEKNTLDALRSTLGLSVANHYSCCGHESHLGQV